MCEWCELQDQQYTCMSTHLWQKHGIIWSSGSSSGHGEKAKVQMNLPITVTKTGQLRISDTMLVKGPLSFNSPRPYSITNAIAEFITKDMIPCYLK
jgi:hypothetical protein